MTKLSVEVRGHDIIISSPETGHSVTYRRVHHEPMLVALDSMRDDPHTENEFPCTSLESRLLKS